MFNPAYHKSSWGSVLVNRSNLIERENKKLRKANKDLIEANRKIRDLLDRISKEFRKTVKENPSEFEEYSGETV